MHRSENYWCINKFASPQNAKATEDFLAWVVTSSEGRDMLANQMGFETPFRAFSDATGEFVHALWYTALFSALSTVLTNLFGLLIALVLVRGLRGANFLKKENARVRNAASVPARYRRDLHGRGRPFPPTPSALQTAR